MKIGHFTYSTHFKRVIIKYEKLYAKEFDSLDEMDTFLERQKLPKLSQEEIENLNSSGQYLPKKLNSYLTPSDKKISGRNI